MKSEEVVKKRLELQEKLEKRARKREVRSLKKSSSTVKKTTAAQIDSYPTSSDDVVSNPDDKESLEWDSNEESISPTFLAKSLNASDPLVDEIIKDISLLNSPAGHSSEEEAQVSTSVKRNTRKKYIHGRIFSR